MTVGYVGLGAMGGALAGRLQLRHSLLVCDSNQAAVQRLVDHGATACSDLSELASRCDVILLCLPTSNEVRQVIFGERGLAESLRRGTLIVDQTSGDPSATRAMAADAELLGVHLIDAPVSGGVPAAHAGTITIMVGAADAHYARVLPFLSAISPNVFHTGGVGTGHTMKLVNNLLSCAQRLLTLEGVALAAKNGLEPRTAVEVLVASGGRNAYLENVMGPHVLNGDLEIGFTLGLAHKDVRLACQLGVESEVPMFFGNLTRELYQLVIAEKGSDAKVDVAAIVMDRLAGTHVVPDRAATVNPSRSPVATFALVHGGLHQGWHLRFLRASLERMGHDTVAPTVPMHDLDAGPSDWAQVIASAVSDADDAIVVGHSLAGLAVPLVATLVPLQRMVFMCANVPLPGVAYEDYLAEQSKAAIAPPVEFDPDGRLTLSWEVARDFLYQDCDEALAREAYEHLLPSAVARANKVKCPLDAWPTTPSSFIACVDDRIIGVEWARQVSVARLGGPAIELPGGHSPFLSRPEHLAWVLDSLVARD